MELFIIAVVAFACGTLVGYFTAPRPPEPPTPKGGTPSDPEERPSNSGEAFKA